MNRFLKQCVIMITVLVLPVACAPDKNDMLTKLINEKKTTEDSLRIVTAIQMDFQGKAKANKADSNIAFAFIDSSTHYSMEARRFKMRLDKIIFSIDSLSMMK